MTVLGAISTGFNAVSSAIPLLGRLPSSSEVFRFAIQAFVSSVNHSSNLAQWTLHPRIANKFTSLADFVSNYAITFIRTDSSVNAQASENQQLDAIVKEARLLADKVLVRPNPDPRPQILVAVAFDAAKVGRQWQFKKTQSILNAVAPDIFEANQRVEAAYAKAFAKADILAPVIRGAVARARDLVDEVREHAEAFDQADAAKFDI